MPVINSPELEKQQSNNLLTWLLPRLKAWKDHRDANWKDKFSEYYRLWRGIWAPDDMTRKSERSRLISPALQQAVESSVSEMTEATFGGPIWFDINDDVQDQNPGDISSIRETLREDLEEADTPEGLEDAMLIGALWGTGIGEIIVDKRNEREIIEAPVEGTMTSERTTLDYDKFVVRLNPVLPSQFIIDPSASRIEDALGVAIEDIVPRHKIVMGIQEGVYNKVVIGDFSENEDVFAFGESPNKDDDRVKVCRYYGLVPERYLREAMNEARASEPSGNEDEEEWKNSEWKLVEAIVIIANDQVILKAENNPYLMGDRPVIAYQWDRVPKKFWGRGVAEKGYNPQKALDAELRARIDALALTTHPMMAIDVTRLPRGMKPEVAPGNTIPTNGDPREILLPVTFGNVDRVTFAQSGELERMIQMGTGAIDTATPVGISPRNNTAGGMSMMIGAAIKRQKRNLQNFQKRFLVPFIKKAYWRYVQFDPIRYPVSDIKFRATGTLGIVARELEQQQLVQLLSVTEPKSELFGVVVKAMIGNSSLSNKHEIMAAFEAASQPDPNEVMLQQEEVMARIERERAQTDYLKGQLEGIKIKAQMEAAKLLFETNQTISPKDQAELMLREKEIDTNAVLGARKLQIEAEKVEISAVEKVVQLENQLSEIQKQLQEFIQKLSNGVETLPRGNVGDEEIVPEYDEAGNIVRIRHATRQSDIVPEFDESGKIVRISKKRR